MNIFEPWVSEIDMTFTDLDVNDSAAKAYHLCPYSTVRLREALSINSMLYRVNLIDAIILKGLRV